MARTPAGGLGPQLPVAAHGRQSVADVILIADHHQHHACEDEDKGHDVGRVEDSLPADDGQNSGGHRLDIAVEGRMDRGEFLRTPVLSIC